MDVFDLQARLRLNTDEFKNGIDESKNLVSKLKDEIGSVLATVTKTTLAITAAATAALAAYTKSAVDEYANYEQLVGGAETLFKNSSSKLIEYANNAYRTAGLSANEYLETATSFASSLVQSLARTNIESGEVNEEALENQQKVLKENCDESEEMLEKSHERQVQDFRKMVDAQIELIDKQYTENLKLIDEERYNRIKAIDEQIDAINAEQEAENEAATQRKRQSKLDDLESKLEEARMKGRSRDVLQLEKELSEYKDQIREEDAKKERQAQIRDLQNQKSAIQEEYNQKKEQLKEEYQAQKKIAQDSYAEQLQNLKDSQKAERDELKKSNDEKIANFKSYVAEQKKLSEEGGNYVVNYTSESYEKAADYADMAITDMSDNANKMGTQMESIQNAYNGFAKQNYTMLDNLKLGYGGTKSEMERLLHDAEAISGVEYDVTSFADIVEAIHIIQQQIGITGTTAAEAAGTISGSAGSMSAAWKNLKIEIGKENGNIKESFEILVKSAMTSASNIVPRVKQILLGIGEAFKIIVPMIADAVPQAIKALNEVLGKVDLSKVGTLIGNAIKSGLDGLSYFVQELDWGLIARQLTDCIMHIDWVGILKSVAGLIVNIVKQVPDIVGNIYHGIVDGITDLLSGDIGSISSEMEDAFSGAREETKNLHDELVNARSSMNEMRESAEELILKEESQVEHTQKLWKELQTLVDENGKVKEGYENRAAFITGELSRATGTEIELIDGQIAKYDELKASIDGLIQKKRASIMGNAYEDVYAAAIQQSASAGSSMRTIREQIEADDVTLMEYYNRFMNGAVQDIINAGITGDEVDKLKNLDFDTFRRSIGTTGTVGKEIEAYFSKSDYENIMNADKDRTRNNDNLAQLQKNQNEFNLIIEKYEKAQEAMMAESYYEAEGYYRQIGNIQNGTFVDMEEGFDDYLEYIKTNLDEALVDYRDAIEAEAYGADEELTHVIRGLIERGLNEGLTGAELLSTGVVEELSKIDHFDTSQLKSFMEQTGLELGDLAKKSVFTSLSSEWQSLITQMLYDTNNLIKPVVNDDGSIRFGGINSPGDVQAYLHADGGIFRKETHIFGEAGAEAVIPLSNDELGIRQIADALSRNMGGAGTVINVNLDGANISSDYDVDRLTDRVIEKISEGMESLRIRDSRGYGGVYA